MLLLLLLLLLSHPVVRSVIIVVEGDLSNFQIIPPACSSPVTMIVVGVGRGGEDGRINIIADSPPGSSTRRQRRLRRMLLSKRTVAAVAERRLFHSPAGGIIRRLMIVVMMSPMEGRRRRSAIVVIYVASMMDAADDFVRVRNHARIVPVGARSRAPRLLMLLMRSGGGALLSFSSSLVLSPSLGRVHDSARGVIDLSSKPPLKHSFSKRSQLVGVGSFLPFHR